MRKDARFEIVTPPRFALTCFVVKVRTSMVTHTLSLTCFSRVKFQEEGFMNGMQAKLRLAVKRSLEFQNAVLGTMVNESGRALTTCTRVGVAHENCMHAQGQQGNETAALVDAVNQSGKAFMISTKLSGQTVARFAIGGAQTQQRHVRAAWQLICETADGLLATAQA